MRAEKNEAYTFSCFIHEWDYKESGRDYKESGRDYKESGRQ